MRERIKWVDMAKAIGIFTIVLGHTVAEGTLKTCVYSFHIPLFFFLSGATFRVKEKPFGAFVKDKALGLLVPYAVFALISQAVYTLMQGMASSLIQAERSFSLAAGWTGILTGVVEANRALWFLPCLFLMSLMLYPIIRGLERRAPHARAFAVCAMAASVLFTVLDEYLFRIGSLPWKLDAAVKLLAFPLGGWFFIRAAERIPLRKAALRACGLALLLIGCGSGIFLNDRVMYLTAVYGNVPVFYLSSVSSVLGLSFLLMEIKSCPVLEKAGRHTLAILVMHKFPVLFFEWVCPVVKDWMAAGWMPAEIAVVIISMAMCCAAEWIIMKICPFMLGRFPRAGKRQG